MPPRVCSFARWVHMPLRRGRRYWSCANCTWSLPSRVRAWRPKMSRINAVRSMILMGSPSARSRLDCCEGLRSSSKITTSASRRCTKPRSSSTLPEPMYVLGEGRSSRWVSRATTTAPAVSARRSSSSSERSVGHRPSRVSTPMSTARSATRSVEMSWNRLMRRSPRKRCARRRHRFPARPCRASESVYRGDTMQAGVWHTGAIAA